MGYKKQRLGPRLVAAARSGARYRDVHVFIGGTGAVGGTALLQMLDMYEEMFALAPPAPDDVPVLVATGRTEEEIRAFSARLVRYVQARHGAEKLPRRIKGAGYLTHSGVFVAIERFSVTSLPGLEGLRAVPPEARRAVVERFLERLGADPSRGADEAYAAMARAVGERREIAGFLERYQRAHLAPRGVARYRSVTVGIPIPSLLAYHQDEIAEAARCVEGLGAAHLDGLKGRYEEAFRDDLARVQRDLADAVLVAHTTGVGGMYDEDPETGRRTIRLGFAHSAADARLADKQRFAERLTDLYARAGIKMLITAAAIGIDEVRMGETVPVHFGVAQKLFDHPDELFPGAKSSLPEGARASRRAGRPVPQRQVARSFRPLTVPLDAPPGGPARFERGEPIRPSYMIRSGENGFFSVANADALYRVMRVASASELGLVLATVGLFGDDPLAPWFTDNICYYTETDNARQVADFLASPALQRAQRTGLDPLALQDLGSARHQGELHMLGLLILLHRLRTLDLDAINPYIDVDRFDPEQFFIEHSRDLTFEDVATWDLATLAADLTALVSAEAPEDLARFGPQGKGVGMFPRKDEAQRRVLARVLQAVWAVPSLGSPIVFERGGAAHVRAGYFVAPLERLVTTRDAVARALREAHASSHNPCSYEDFRDYNLAVGGFVDVRPHAIVCTATNPRADLTGRVLRARDEAGLRAALGQVEPYAVFSTCGLLAVLFRLQALYRQLREGMVELGTLQGCAWHMPRDADGHMLLVPGVVEAFRMVSEGLEKTTGTERLDGLWGYERRAAPDRRGAIPGLGGPNDEQDKR